jgi:hypothetical protein
MNPDYACHLLCILGMAITDALSMGSVYWYRLHFGDGALN